MFFKYFIMLEIIESDDDGICRRMVLVCGTSTCHMAISKTKLFIPGVWGPFWSGNFFFYPHLNNLQKTRNYLFII